MVGAEPTSRLPVSDGPPDRSFEDRSSEPPAPSPAADRQPAPDAGERGLLSAPAAAAVDSAFNALAHTVQVRDGRTLLDCRTLSEDEIDEVAVAVASARARKGLSRR